MLFYAMGDPDSRVSDHSLGLTISTFYTATYKLSRQLR